VTPSLLVSLPMPPSVNALYRVFRNRSILSKQGRDWYNIAIPSLQAQANGWRCPNRAALTLNFRFPDHRRCDLSNRIKALEDAITKAGLWDDDSLVDEVHLYRCAVDKDNPGVLITIKPLDESPTLIVRLGKTRKASSALEKKTARK
jgi:crossover junction endodeoxyribonuclease RusA